MATKSQRRVWSRDKKQRQEFEPWICHRYENINGRLVETNTSILERAEREGRI